MAVVVSSNDLYLNCYAGTHSRLLITFFVAVQNDGGDDDDDDEEASCF